MDKYKALSTPPKWALRTIQAGRIKGMTDVSPQWRYQAMTQVFGLCGVGWKYEVTKKWTEAGPDGIVFAFVDVDLYIMADANTVPQTWSAPIPGTGGNVLIAKERAGLHANDEAWKMATTDALSTAMKMIGVAADIYAGMWDGSKYKNAPPPPAGVTEAELNNLKIAWAKEHADDLAGLDKLAMLNAFRVWVKLTLGKAYTLGGEWDVGDYKAWSTEDMITCLTKGKKE